VLVILALSMMHRHEMIQLTSKYQLVVLVSTVDIERRKQDER
jgi:hypothetical protein